MVQARAATGNASAAFHLAEFLVGVGSYTYLGISHSPGWGCNDGWLELGIPGDVLNFCNSVLISALPAVSADVTPAAKSGDALIWSRPLGEPLANYKRVPGGANPFQCTTPCCHHKPPPQRCVPTGDWVYTRSFAGKHKTRAAALAALEKEGSAGKTTGKTAAAADAMTHLWLNLTDGAFWKHAKSCVHKQKDTCPKACIWWGDGGLTKWPLGANFTCNRSVLLGF